MSQANITIQGKPCEKLSDAIKALESLGAFVEFQDPDNKILDPKQIDENQGYARATIGVLGKTIYGSTQVSPILAFQSVVEYWKETL